MTDSPEDSRQLKQAIVWRDDKPLLELTAEEFIYPVTTTDDAFKVYVHLSPYSAHEVQAFFDAFIPRSKRRTGRSLRSKRWASGSRHLSSDSWRRS